MPRKKIHKIDGVRIRFDEPVEILEQDSHFSLDTRNRTTVIPRYSLCKDGQSLADYLLQSGMYGATQEAEQPSMEESAAELRSILLHL